jgi:hypothetical protein
MCDSFVHTIRGLQARDSNWAGLPIISNQLVMSIQKVYGKIKLRYNS